MGRLPVFFWIYDLQKFKLKGWRWERGAAFDNCWGGMVQPDAARIGVRRRGSFGQEQRANTLDSGSLGFESCPCHHLAR